MRPPCSVEGCEKVALTRGFCSMHYARLVRHGDVSVVKRPSIPSAVERFWQRVDQAGGCWLWIGTRTTSGYGYFSPAGGKRVAAHRFSAALHFGMFDQRLHVLHMCDNPACVNPEHLQLGSHAENMRQMSERGRASGSKKTHCPQGHPYDQANTYVWRRNRYCRACNNAIRRDRRNALVPAGAR